MSQAPFPCPFKSPCAKKDDLQASSVDCHAVNDNQMTKNSLLAVAEGSCVRFEVVTTKPNCTTATTTTISEGLVLKRSGQRVRVQVLNSADEQWEQQPQATAALATTYAKASTTWIDLKDIVAVLPGKKCFAFRVNVLGSDPKRCRCGRKASEHYDQERAPQRTPFPLSPTSNSGSNSFAPSPTAAAVNAILAMYERKGMGAVTFRDQLNP